MEEYIVVEQSKTPDGKTFINADCQLRKTDVCKGKHRCTVEFDDRIQVMMVRQC
jgi:hypothetical protein